MTKYLCIFIALTFCTSPSLAKKHSHKKRHHDSHEHGQGQLNLVTDGNDLVVELKVPAMDIVGFEHKPSTSAQKTKVQNAVKWLKEASSNITPSTKAKCEPQTAKVETELLAETKKDHHHHDHHDHEEEIHSEFHVTYKWSCSKIKNLNFIKVLSFKKFKGMKKLKAQGVTSQGAFSKTLNLRSHQFDLK